MVDRDSGEGQTARMSKLPTVPVMSDAEQDSAEPGLSRRHIAEVALVLIDRDGLSAFSLRQLARELGVSAPALYWHLPNKNAVLAEVVSLVVADILPSGELSWQDFLRQVIGKFRSALHLHPNAAPLLGAEIVANSATDLDLVEGILRALSRAGFEGAHLVAAYNATCVAMVGFVIEELCPMPEEADVWQMTVRERLAQSSSDRFPLLTQYLPALADKAFMLRWRSGISAPMDEGFAFFVEVFIAGLAVMACRA